MDWNLVFFWCKIVIHSPWRCVVSQKRPKVVVNNLVAKHMHKFNKPAVHANKKKDYKRSPKHKSRFGDCSFWRPIKFGTPNFTFSV